MSPVTPTMMKTPRTTIRDRFEVFLVRTAIVPGDREREGLVEKIDSGEPELPFRLAFGMPGVGAGELVECPASGGLAG